MTPKQLSRLELQLKTLVLLSVAGVVYCTALGVMESRFETNFTYHLRLAAYTDDAGLAREELEKTLGYAVDHNLTEGNSGVFDCVPENDLKCWFLKINTLAFELQTATGEEEKREAVELVRKSLLSPKGQVVMPRWLAFYPYQTWVMMPVAVFMSLFITLAAVTFTEVGLFFFNVKFGSLF